MFSVDVEQPDDPADGVLQPANGEPAPDAGAKPSADPAGHEQPDDAAHDARPSGAPFLIYLCLAL